MLKSDSLHLVLEVIRYFPVLWGLLVSIDCYFVSVCLARSLAFELYMKWMKATGN
jgi:hypothetical protein